MKSYIIAIPDHNESQMAADKCIQSSKDLQNDFEITKFNAITPKDVDKLLKEFQIKWNYPWEGKVTDFSTGLTKSAYSTNNPKARIACSLSHYKLWKECSEADEPYLILEHDSIFIRQINYHMINRSLKLIISLNNPRFATRRAVDYLNSIKTSAPDKFGVVFAPSVDDPSIPQGLPGNSSYIIKPSGAKKMLKLVEEYGLWPNDALMCKQLIPQIGCTQRFYTRVQGIRSTTSL
jgi:GR25 family glycosyltransferase involved in LPS biosynthesis